MSQTANSRCEVRSFFQFVKNMTAYTTQAYAGVNIKPLIKDSNITGCLVAIIYPILFDEKQNYEKIMRFS